MNQTTTTTTTDDNGGEERPRGDELVFPSSFSATAVAEAERMLAAFSLPLAQALLDELAGRLQATAVLGKPLAYLRGLVKRAQAGDFTPESGLSITEHYAQPRMAERLEAAERLCERQGTAPGTALELHAGGAKNDITRQS